MIYRFVIVFAMVLACFAGCGHPVPTATPSADKITTAEKVRDVKQAEAAIQPKLFRVRDLVADLTTDNLAATKPQLQQLIGGSAEFPGGVIEDFSDLQSKTVTLEKAQAQDVKAKQADERTIAALTDPEKASIRHWGELGILIGLLVIGVYFSAGFIPVVGPWIQKGGKFVLFAGCFLVGLGLVLITLARFLVQLEWIIAGTLGAGFIAALVVVGIYVWKHHTAVLGLTALAGGRPVVMAAAQPPDPIAIQEFSFAKDAGP